MLQFDIRSLENQAEVVDGYLAPDDDIWVEGDPLPAEPIHVTGRLSAAGAERFYWHGHIAGSVAGECRRCLAPASDHVSDEVHVVFAGEHDPDADEDPDVFRFDSRTTEIDLRTAIRETWLLVAPAFVQCRPDCKGLCPVCGADRNEVDCGHTGSATDSRWDALRKLGETQ